MAHRATAPARPHRVTPYANTAPAWLRVAAPLGVALLTFLVFSPALRNEFVSWDDWDNIVRNEHFRGLGAEQLHWMFTTRYAGHYQPLSWMSLAFDYLVARGVFGNGLDPRCYHFTNCVLHAANAALVYFLALAFFRRAGAAGAAPDRSASYAAVIAALLFALHPLRVESVAWVTERRDVLGSFFLLLTVGLYLRAPLAPAGARWRWLAPALLTFALSLLSRALAVVVPLILLLLDFYPLRRFAPPAAQRRAALVRAVLEKAPFFALAGVLAVAAVTAQSSALAAYELGQYGPLARLAQMCYALVFYVYKTLWPAALAPIYELRLPLDVAAPRYVLSALAVTIATAVIAWLARRGRAPWLVIAVLVYAVLVLPVSGLVQSGRQEVADRYSYVPGAVFALLAAGGLLRLWRAKVAGPLRGLSLAGTCVVLAVLGGLTWRQCGIWRNTATLWTHAVRVQPDSAIAQNEYGLVAWQQGSAAAALPHFERAIALWPQNALAHQNAWRALAELGREDDLVTALRHATEVFPDFADAHHNLAWHLARRGQVDAAIAAYEKAIAARPDHSGAHTNLANLLQERGDAAGALRHYRAAVAADTQNVSAWLGLTESLAAQGERDAARQALERVLRLDPANPRALELRAALGK